MATSCCSIVMQYSYYRHETIPLSPTRSFTLKILSQTEVNIHRLRFSPENSQYSFITILGKKITKTFHFG